MLFNGDNDIFLDLLFIIIIFIEENLNFLFYDVYFYLREKYNNLMLIVMNCYFFYIMFVIFLKDSFLFLINYNLVMIKNCFGRKISLLYVFFFIKKGRNCKSL